MKRIFRMILIAFLILGLMGCSSKSPKIVLSDRDIMVQINDKDFSKDHILHYITVEDSKGNLLPMDCVSIMGEFDITKPGNYPLTITASDKDHSTVETISLNVVDVSKPIIYVVDSEILVYKGTKFNPDPKMNLIYAIDNFSDDLTERMTSEGTVDSKKIGIYPVVYKVSDESGNIAEKEVVYRVTDSLDEYAMYLYNRAIAFYWGDYFIVDSERKVLNYDDAVYYFFTTAGQKQFEKASGLRENKDCTQGGIMLTKVGEDVFLPEQDKIFINNYLSTKLTKSYRRGIYLKYLAAASYGDGIKTILTLDSQFNLKRVDGKWYVDEFALPN